jgi:hypothetical protein
VVRIMTVVVALGIAVGSLVGACTLLADDPPANSCKTDADCFTNVEQCNVQKSVCEPKPDAGP